MMRRSSFQSEGSTKDREAVEWEMWPNGMLVQKHDRKPDIPVPDLRLRIAYGTLCYDISTNSQATFGELKKLLSVEAGLQPGEQQLIFRGKEKEDGDYLDMSGIKDQSKIILIEDPSSHEKRFIEMRRNAKIQSARRAISDLSMEVNKLADKVSAIEKSISNGTKVVEVQITTLIEMLMRQAIKLDSVSKEGDVSAQKNLQSKRVQKCVETLDVLKVSNARINPMVVTMKWEKFEPWASTQWEFFD